MEQQTVARMGTHICSRILGRGRQTHCGRGDWEPAKALTCSSPDEEQQQMAGQAANCSFRLPEDVCSFAERTWGG